MPNIQNSLWPIYCLWTLTLFLTVSPVWPMYCELQPLHVMQYIKLLDAELSTKLGKTHSDVKRSHSLTLRAKVNVIAKIKRQCPREQ